MASDAAGMPAERLKLECDIVMAGGVTSGIIYPGAVEQISRKYRFRAIGGTSVGAIGAAVAAAAEYGRITGKNPHAFDAVGAMPTSLGQKASDRHSRLFHLFTAEPATRPLYGMIMPLFSGDAMLVRACRVVLKSLAAWPVALATTLALIPGLVLLFVAASHLVPDGRLICGLAVGNVVVLSAALWCLGTRGWFLALAVLLSGVVLMTGLAWTAVNLARALPAELLVLIGVLSAAGFTAIGWAVSAGLVLKNVLLPALMSNRYGLCTGLADPDLAAKPGQEPFLGLTNWMHAQVQQAAGRTVDDHPLTFGDLWDAREPGAPPAEGGDKIAPAARPRTIDLAMIASDISRNRTAQIPFLEMQSPLFVEKATLDAFFPAAIVAWMVSRAGPADHPAVRNAPHLVRLPPPHDLPVVFGARLSLSFPILLSAFPMRTVAPVEGAGAHSGEGLRPVWFSDGGLTSNFPIHFFDSPIPSRPTFCLNLIDYGTGTPTMPARRERPRNGKDAGPASSRRSGHSHAAGADLRLTDLVKMAASDGELPVQFTEIDHRGLGAFLWTLLNTARFWNDNELLGAPGVRDRVVNIGLFKDEGGLNLDMPQDTIEKLDERGIEAGRVIAEQFYPDRSKPNGSAFANHRWVRYRNFMAAFEDLTRRFARAHQDSDTKAGERGEPTLFAMIDGQAKDPLVYPIPKRLRPYYLKVTKRLRQLSLDMAADTRADRGSFDGANASSDASPSPRPKMRFRLRPIVNDDPRLVDADLPKPFPPLDADGAPFAAGGSATPGA